MSKISLMNFFFVSTEIHQGKLTSISMACNWRIYIFPPEFAAREALIQRFRNFFLFFIHCARVENVIYMQNAFIRSQLWNVLQILILLHRTGLIIIASNNNCINVSLLNIFMNIAHDRRRIMAIEWRNSTYTYMHCCETSTLSGSTTHTHAQRCSRAR